VNSIAMNMVRTKKNFSALAYPFVRIVMLDYGNQKR